MSHRPRRLPFIVGFALLLAACAPSGGGASPTDQEPRTVQVQMTDDLRFEPAQFTVQAGDTVRFEVTNAGATAHEFLIGDEAAQDGFEMEMSGSSAMPHATDAGVRVEPGGTETFEYTFGEAGQLACGLPRARPLRWRDGGHHHSRGLIPNGGTSARPPTPGTRIPYPIARRNRMTDLFLPPFGRLAWIDVVLLAWFVLTALSVAYVAWDAYRNNPELTVMKWGWVLVTLYLGPDRPVPLRAVVQGALPGPSGSSSRRPGSRRSARPSTAWPATRRASSSPPPSPVRSACRWGSTW